jgi:hypothetical protein
MSEQTMKETGFLQTLANIWSAIWNVPTCDKVLGAVGASVSTVTLSAGIVSEYLGWAVAAATVFMVLPRGILNWNELLADRRKKRDARIRASMALEEADRSSKDLGPVD